MSIKTILQHLYFDTIRKNSDILRRETSFPLSHTHTHTHLQKVGNGNKFIRDAIKCPFFLRFCRTFPRSSFKSSGGSQQTRRRFTLSGMFQRFIQRSR